MDYFNDDEQQKPRAEVVISDLRHRRDGDDAELESEPESADATTTAEDAATVETTADKSVEVSAEPVYDSGPGDSYGDLPPGVSEDDLRQAEREQLKQLIGLGLANYLRYQLSMVLNFALLNLGSAADPNTGLVTKDLPQAKLAIDVFEFLVARLEPEMEPAERAQMSALVQDLKHAFMQAAATGAPPAGTPQA